MDSLRDRVCQHVASIGIHHKEAARFSSLINKWVTKSGPEWTVDRLKALRQSFLDSLSTGGPYSVPPGWACRKNRDGKKIFTDKLIHQLFSSRAIRSEIDVAELFLRCYQAIQLPQGTVSDRQLSKFIKAVTAPTTSDGSWINSPELSTLIRYPGSDTISLIVQEGEKAKSLPEMLGSAKMSPVITVNWDYSYSITTSRRDDITAVSGDYVDQLRYDKALWNLWNSYPREINRATGRPEDSFIYFANHNIDLPAGTITALQEPGCKVRWIANPTLLLQSLGEPLKLKLHDYLRRVYPDVCAVDDQDSGRRLVQSWFIEEKTVYSYDLSSFTDRWPLEHQVSVLRTLLHYGIISRFDYDSFIVVVEKWWVSKPTKNELIKWSVGQPLGFGPSFALATLSHIACLEGLANNLGVPNEFCIVGDDVVIGNEPLAMAYETMMLKMGVEINDTKTLISKSYVEFLGKLINKEGYSETIKVRPIESPEALITRLRVYGQRSIEYLTPRERRIHYLCYLPEDLGGLSWVPSGIPRTRTTETKKFKTIVRKLRTKKNIQDFTGPTGQSSVYASSIEAAFNFAERNEVPRTKGLLADCSRTRREEQSKLESSGVALEALTFGNTGEDIQSTLTGSVKTPPRHALHNDFIHLVDKATDLEKRDNKARKPDASAPSDSIEELLRNEPLDLLRILDEDGYMYDHEPAYTANSSIQGFDHVNQTQPAYSSNSQRKIAREIRESFEHEPGWEPEFEEVEETEEYPRQRGG